MLFSLGTMLWYRRPSDECVPWDSLLRVIVMRLLAFVISHSFEIEKGGVKHSQERV